MAGPTPPPGRWPAALLPLLLGAGSALAFAPVGLWPLMPLAFAGLAALVDRRARLGGALLSGWLFGVGQFVVGLNWIATSFTYQAAMPAWLGWVAVVLLSLYLAVYPMLAAGLAWRFGRNRPLGLVLALAGGWGLCEWLRATMFTGFSWNPVGVALVDTPLRGWTTLVGTYGLSILLVAAGGALWLLARRQFRSGGAILALVLVPALFLAPRFAPSGPRHSVRIVQPNIGQDVKWDEGMNGRSLALLNALSLKGAPEKRLLFWPEAAVIEPLADERPAARWQTLDERLAATRALGPEDLLLTGGITYQSRDGERLSGAANSVFALAPLGQLVGRYDKAHLVPYGEYLPMRPLLSALGLSRLAPGDLDFTPGPGPRTLALPGGLKVGMQLCYEIIFSGEVVDRAHRPDLIFNPSNDAWFGRWGPPQHLAQARLRATEEGVWVVRATPTGISALVDPAGRVVAALPWRQAGVIDGEVSRGAPPTFFSKVGNLLPILLGFALLIWAIAMSARRR